MIMLIATIIMTFNLNNLLKRYVLSISINFSFCDKLLNNNIFDFTFYIVAIP